MKVVDFLRKMYVCMQKYTHAHTILRVISRCLWIPWSPSMDLKEFKYHVLRIRFEQPSSSEKAPHSSTLAWKIPWTEEPGRLQSMGSLRVGHDGATSLSLFTFMHWRRKRQPTPVFLLGETQGRRSLVGCRLWGGTESNTTEATQQQQPSSHHTTNSHTLKSSFKMFFWSRTHKGPTISIQINLLLYNKRQKGVVGTRRKKS